MNTTKTTNAVRLGCAYCRVSTDMEEQKKSIQEQQKQWLEFFSQTGAKSANVGLLCHKEVARIKEDGTVVKGKLVTEPRTDGLYIDEGVSGKSLQNRMAFLRMIEDAMLKKFDMIYVEDVSRFSRSMEDGYTVIKNLRDIGVGVFFRKEGWDSLDLSKDFELQLRLSIAQEENRGRSERAKWAMDRLRKNGGWDTAPPYGYDKKAGFLYVNEDEAEIVQKIFHWFTVDKWGLGKICRELNDNDVPTKRDGKWRFATIKKILKNEIYLGKMVSHKTESFDITRHTTKAIDPEEWVTRYDDTLRIIDDDTFALAQVESDRRTEDYNSGIRRRLKDKNTNDYRLLSGLLFCAHCGSSFRRKSRNHYVKKDGTITDRGYVWFCKIQDHYGDKVCPAGRVAVKEDDCIEAIKYEIQQLKNGNTDSFYKLYIREKFKGVAVLDKKALEKKSNDLNGEMRQLRQDMRDGLIDTDLYREQMKELNAEIGAVKADLSRMTRMAEEKRHIAELYDKYKMTLQEVDTENLTNSVLRSIFRKIYVSYKIDSTGKKIPTLRFVYNFLDVTNDEILQSSKLDGADIKIFTSLYTYKNVEEINKSIAENE